MIFSFTKVAICYEKGENLVPSAAVTHSVLIKLAVAGTLRRRGMRIARKSTDLVRPNTTVRPACPHFPELSCDTASKPYNFLCADGRALRRVFLLWVGFGRLLIPLQSGGGMEKIKQLFREKTDEPVQNYYLSVACGNSGIVYGKHHLFHFCKAGYLEFIIYFGKLNHFRSRNRKRLWA